jgi:glutaconate CoA-transferase subunit B
MPERGLTDRVRMIVAAARLLRDQERVLVGVGQPNLAANLAKRVHAPRLMLIYESGVIDAHPTRLPLSIGDAELVRGALTTMPMVEFFMYYLQGGRIDVGFIGGAQVDRWGNVNSTVIGPYERPTVRLAGSGGAADIAALAHRLIIMTPHEPRRFPAQVDFVTAVGHRGGRDLHRGPWKVITNLGQLGFAEDGEMVLEAVFPGVTIPMVQAATGWPLRVADPVEILADPIPRELAALEALEQAIV